MSSATTTLRMILLGEDKSAGKALKGVGDETDKTSKKMQAFHKVGTAAGVALAGGLALAGKAAIDFTKEAAANQAGAALLARNLQHAAGATKGQVAATEEWITKQGEAVGVSRDQLRPALSQLAIATGSVSKAQHLATVAMNVAAARGLSLKSVSLALAKAQTGNVSGLSRLGIATKDAAGNTLSLHAVTKELTNTYSGAAAKAADTTAGKQKILAVQMEDLRIKIGTGLIPVMAKLMAIGLGIVNWISNNTKVAGVLVGVLGGLLAVTYAVSVATKLAATGQALWTAAQWVGGAATSALMAVTKLYAVSMLALQDAAIGTRIGLAALFVQEKIGAAATKAMAAAQWLLNVAMDANPIGLVVIALAALAVGLVIAYKHSATFRAIVQGAFHAVQAAASFAFNWVKHNWPLLVGILLGPVGIATVLIIKNWGKIKAATASVWNAIKSIVKGAWQGIVAIVQLEINIVLTLIKSVASGIMKLGGLFLSAGKSLVKSLFEGFMSAARGGMGFVTNLVGAVKSAINSALHLPLMVNFDKGPLHIHATVIPALAKGGIVTRPTMALIGEAGPEAVVPLSGKNAGGFGGNTYITVNTNGLVDPATMVKKIGVEMRKQGLLNGGRNIAVST